MKIEVLEIKKNEDGTSQIIFDYDDEFLTYVKLMTGKEDPSEEELSKFFLDVLEEQLKLQKKEKSND